MSYNLRSRNSATSGESPFSAISAPTAAQRTVDVEHSPEDTTRSWSDVVANRPPSPLKGDGKSGALAGAAYPTTKVSGRDIALDSEKAAQEAADRDDGNQNPWIKVTRRRSRSLDDNKSRLRNDNIPKARVEPDPVFKAAESRLTPAQKDHIEKRHKK
ncbi:hypothetical protein H0H93_001899, partial [Arthromyces matolae]